MRTVGHTDVSGHATGGVCRSGGWLPCQLQPLRDQLEIIQSSRPKPRGSEYVWLLAARKGNQFESVLQKKRSLPTQCWSCSASLPLCFIFLSYFCFSDVFRSFMGGENRAGCLTGQARFRIESKKFLPSNFSMVLRLVSACLVTAYERAWRLCLRAMQDQRCSGCATIRC